MEFSFTEEQQKLRQEIHDFFMNELPAEYRKVISKEMESLPAYEKARGEPRGLWDMKKPIVPSWDIWKEYYEKIY